MKLLILGLIAILLVLIRIYYINKEGLENKEKIVEEEIDLNKSQARNYGILASVTGEEKIKDGVEWIDVVKKTDGNITFKGKPVEKQIQSTSDDIDIRACNGMNAGQAEDACSQLDQPNNKCGYCAETKKFSFATLDGKNTAVDVDCNPRKWTMDAGKCSELRDKEICDAVKTCGDLYGEAEKLCAWCPTTGKALPMKNIDGKLVTKYDTDVCPASGGFSGNLLSKEKCGAFLKEHPCITPYHASGPHSGDCMKKLWNNACTPPGLERLAKLDNKDVNTYVDAMGKAYGSDGIAGIKSYSEIGALVQNFEKGTRDSDYNVAKSNSEICYGKSNLDPCDTLYDKNGIPHSECLKQKYLEVGCTTEGTGYAALNGGNLANHIEEVNTYNSSQFTRDSKTGNITYKKGNKKATKESYLKNLSSLESLTINAEDYKTRKITSKICYGKEPPPPPPIKKGDTVTVNVLGRKYEGIAVDEGTIGGVKRAKVMWYQYSNFDGKNVVKRESQTEKEKNVFGWPDVAPINRLATLNRGNIIGSGGWINTKKLKLKKSCSDNTSSCNKTCKDIIRDILLKYPRPLDCVQSSWSAWSRCSTYPKDCGGGEMKRTRTVKFPPQFNGKPCGPSVQKKPCNTNPCLNKNFKPPDVLPLQNNKVGPPFRENFKIMEGMNLRDVNDPSHKSSRSKLGKCQGDCDGDKQCKPGLKCFERNGYTKVPGCEGRGKRDWDYCTDADLINDPKPEPPTWARGKGKRGGGYKETKFRGPLTFTKGGYTCQNWMDNRKPHHSSVHMIPRKCVTGRYSKTRPCTRWMSIWGWCGSSYWHRWRGTNCGKWWKHARRHGLGNHNYCRNPYVGRPHSNAWCYTTDRRKRWDNC